MYDNVLIPTDSSDVASRTVSHALPIAELNDATVHALYVVDSRITNAAVDGAGDDLGDSLEREGRYAVDDVVERAAEAGLDTVSEVRHGTPAKTILEYAEAAGIDLIVIGSTGKSAREKITSLGSVSERVVDNASVPVFVVRASNDS